MIFFHEQWSPTHIFKYFCNFLNVSIGYKGIYITTEYTNFNSK